VRTSDPTQTFPVRQSICKNIKPRTTQYALTCNPAKVNLSLWLIHWAPHLEYVLGSGAIAPFTPHGRGWYCANCMYLVQDRRFCECLDSEINHFSQLTNGTCAFWSEESWIESIGYLESNDSTKQSPGGKVTISLEFITAIIIKNTSLWGMTCSLVVHPRFGGTYCFHLQGRRVSHTSNKKQMIRLCIAYISILKMTWVCSSET
jgi:hypothetical protein